MADRARLQSLAGGILRIVAGVMFACHGAQKILGWWGAPGHPQPPVGSQVWIGGIIELVCGALIALGFFTRPAAFLASGTMAVAYFQFHKGYELGGGHFLPIVNGGEMAVLYCFLFLVYAVSGAGALSVDAARGRA